MKSVPLVLSLLVPLATSCAGVESPSRAPAASPESTGMAVEACAERADEGGVVAALEVASVVHQDAQERSRTGLDVLWRDPTFQKRFVESYLADTEVEPSLTQKERTSMQQVLEVMNSDAPDKTEKVVPILEAARGPAASAVFDFTLGNVLFQAERLEEAGRAYQAAVDKFAKFRRAWRNLGVIRVRQNDFARAVPALSRVIELGGGDAITYGLLGYAHASLANFVAAESAFRMATLLDPATADWKMQLARCLFKEQRYADAATYCGSLIDAEPERADLWLLQANAFIGMNQPQKAAQNFEVVDGLGHSTADSLDMLGDIYINQELYDLAVGAYTRAIPKDASGSVERPIRAAKVLTARGALEQAHELVAAIESTRGASLGDEQKKDLLKLRARLAIAQGGDGEEVAVLEEIVKLDPLDGDALILLGQHYGRSGDPEKAIFWYERAEGIEAFEADAKIRHAQLLVGQGKYALALPLLRRAQTVRPRDNIQQYLEQVERAAQAR
ncbi:MAG: tetratricopeptide repeat protein [Planctomycetota bacterium]